MPNGNATRLIICVEFKKRLVDFCLRHRLSRFPRKLRDQHILLRSVALTLDLTAEYTEEQINDMLTSWLREVGRSFRFDHVNLRRLLVDEGYLDRTSDGSRYWLSALSRNHPVFEPAVEDIDVYEVVRASVELIEMQKRHYSQR